MFNLGDWVRFQIVQTNELPFTVENKVGEIVSVRSTKEFGLVHKDFLVCITSDTSYWVPEQDLAFFNQPLDKSEFDTTIYENLPPPMGQEDMGR